MMPTRTTFHFLDLFTKCKGQKILDRVFFKFKINKLKTYFEKKNNSSRSIIFRKEMKIFRQFFPSELMLRSRNEECSFYNQ